MINLIKSELENFKRNFIFYKRTQAFKKRYQTIKKELFVKNIPENILQEYRKKWSIFGKKVETETLLLCYNLSGKVDLNIVPENIFSAIIETKLNPHKEIAFFELKNVYEKWFNNLEVFPKSYFHKIEGTYYDRDFNIIEDISQFLNSIDFNYPLILKSSRDTYGGEGVRKIKSLEDLWTGIEEFRSLVCQELIIQNESLGSINNSSINSIRTCLLRTETGEFKVINNSIRFGINGSLDNETSGGIVCSIDENGIFNEYAVNKYAQKYFSHPNSNVEFKGYKLPFYESLNLTAENIANQIPLANLISLDMCLDNENIWRCIEINLNGQTIRFAQYAGKGFFGNLTNQIINKTK
ncbi:sugar-transfer associated ATP-grasp domain-containing protein [Sphingobacterium lactis]|uniref:Sugar-transfer associated ATP-grasp n=1 Tax=Sphingobacterium lactis TaxID=797291 RepID=A0A1H5VPQ0_9SPHI|nr:sugar-transfer associated ATP-grasp domain-containing protein [Sphingobacterium lactis]SEF89214.1 Sugar-transfer associated ATP-grasp [Sphingobacterium lactis]